MSPEPRPLVLCVDDEPEVLSALRRLLSTEPLEILTSGDAEQALGIVRSRKVRLLIADQRMPGMSGTSLLSAARNLDPDIRFILLTAYSDPAIVAHCLRERIEGLLVKPWSPEELIQTVRNLTSAPAGGPRPAASSVDCAGLSARTVADRVALLLVRPSVRGGEAVIALENLLRLEDSIGRLLRALWRVAQQSGGQVVFVEATGIAAAYWKALSTGNSPRGTSANDAVRVQL